MGARNGINWRQISVVVVGYSEHWLATYIYLVRNRIGHFISYLQRRKCLFHQVGLHRMGTLLNLIVFCIRSSKVLSPFRRMRKERGDFRGLLCSHTLPMTISATFESQSRYSVGADHGYSYYQIFYFHKHSQHEHSTPGCLSTYISRLWLE